MLEEIIVPLALHTFKPTKKKVFFIQRDVDDGNGKNWRAK